jgi:signal transduction histidine kinase
MVPFANSPSPTGASASPAPHTLAVAADTASTGRHTSSGTAVVDYTLIRKQHGAATAVLHNVIQTFAGCVAIAIVTAVCFRLRLSLAAPLCLDLIVIVLVSLRGSFLNSACVSFVAVWSLAFYFAEPLFSPLVFNPLDVLALALFLVTSGVVTTLVSRLRNHADQLAFTRSKLQEQIAEVKRTQDQLNLARVNRIMLMGEMTASIAHEVNQPLTGILANAGTASRYLVREVPELEEVQRCLSLIVRDGRRAGEVISRIRALAKKAPPDSIRLDLNEAILEVVNLTERDLKAKRVLLQTELSGDLPLILADRVQLQQVLLNLIVNALEAMNEHDGPRELIVTSGQSQSNEVFVEVRDSGPGLDPASFDRLFQSFYTTKPEGMGMGLSISRSIVESHGGRLFATANVPRGAVFRVILPVDPDRAIL